MKPRTKKPPREGFRRRINPYYGDMTRREVYTDIAKTAARWLVVTILAFAYWVFLLLILSLILLGVWKVTIVEVLGYSAVLCAITSAVYAYVLIHRKLYY